MRQSRCKTDSSLAMPRAEVSVKTSFAVTLPNAHVAALVNSLAHYVAGAGGLRHQVDKECRGHGCCSQHCCWCEMPACRGLSLRVN